jgi:hypothetical protein
MKKYIFFVAVLVLTVVVVAGGIRLFRASLSGDNEIPIVYTDASGTFKATLNSDETQIEYELTYAALESAVQQAHIHIGRKSENGGISVWLCSNLASPPTPAGTQPCPTPSGTITGVITAANVVGPASQGVSAGEFAALVRAIKDGNTYTNVHSATSPGGEIRGQIRRGQGHGDHDDEN